MIYDGKFVALKRIRERKPADIEALKREAVVINRLQDPNIIHLLGVCLEHPHIGLVLELCEGGSLKKLCQKLVNSFVPVRVLVDWAAQIASAMCCMAAEGLMHRDLKADNVLVKERVCTCITSACTPTSAAQTIHLHNGIQADGYCQHCRGRALDRLTMKVTDFGNTKKIEDDGDKRQSLVGTYAWMAPEAYKFQKYSEASDVWSFGVLLWELLTRKDPHQGCMPITVAFHVSTKGIDLPIADDCPLNWKNIMQSCWQVAPEKRPTFKELLRLFTAYREELEGTKFSEEQEALVRRVQDKIQKEITEVYVKLNEDGQKEMRLMCEMLYEQLDLRGDSSTKLPEAAAPEVRERRRGKKKIEKQDISQPQECRHLISIQQPTSSKADLKVIVFDRKSSGVPKAVSTNVFGTLPRRDKERLDVHHSALQSNLSVSYPNLNELEDHFGKKCGTLQRKDAIRKKQRPSLPFDQQHIEQERFLQFLDPEGEDRVQNLSAGRVGHSGRRSEGTKDLNKKPNFLAKLFRRGNHSTESDETSPSPLCSSAPLTSRQTPLQNNKGNQSNYEHLSPWHHSSSPSAAGDDYTKLFSPSKVTRNKVSPSDKAIKRHDILCTQQTTRYVKTSTQHPPSSVDGVNAGVTPDIAASHSPRREIGIDEIIPTTTENICPPSIPVKHHHRRTPSDEKAISRQNAFHNGHNAARSPHRSPMQPTLSSVVPLPTSSNLESHTTNAARLPAPSTDPYITCRPHIEVINNVPYLTMTPRNGFGLSGNVVVPPPPMAIVQNDQYIHCPQKPDRPATLNLTHAHTPESSGISTGGSSAFSNLSMADAVPPMIHAPPPPQPPIIPPRDGSIGLSIGE
ncbi:Mitogen-activated protein kinase kinase kinase mlk-1 [Parelaphostrongylus tenuis]|nr:Mitogen-activated protein kinase kinase kinase mlk-1 [Parelaphostrongylus tenuis]